MLLHNLILQERTVEAIEIDMLRQQIRKQCQPYLRAVKGNFGHRAMYRGMEGVSNFRLYRTLPLRSNRNPVSSSIQLHDILDSTIETLAGFKARSNSLFVTGNILNAQEYGETFLIFPIGDFKFVWSPLIADAYSSLDYFPTFMRDTTLAGIFAQYLFENDYLPDNSVQGARIWILTISKDEYYDILEDFMSKNIDKLYKNDDLAAGLNSMNEIMLGGFNEFIAVKLEDFYKDYAFERYSTAVESFIESCY